ncbi:succinate dehydrogenase [Gymnodinialimonas sp. 2305UL16-5]|uniref:succinate dehydrogenase n=1 Tax=Gymnodinialimonas mytili TaxID=3126503 RepID=UPI0030B58911
MIRYLLLPCVAFGLSACVGNVQGAADQVARDQARLVVNSEIARRAPGVDVQALTDCVIDNASASEIVTIAGGYAVGNTSAASNTITGILERRDTIRCTAGAYFDTSFRGLAG